MVCFCTIARGLSAPGQTIGVSAFVDDLIDDLDTTRSAVSTAYLIGTLASAAALPFVGRWIDRRGVRHATTTVVVAFGCVIALTGAVNNVVTLGLAFVGLRMLGQGALTLTATTGVVLWFDQRRGFALAVSTMGGLAILSLSPLTFSAVINAVGWRWTWVVIGAGLLIVMLPIARFGIVDRPEALGQAPDGAATQTIRSAVTSRSHTAAEALRTPAFWTLTGLSMLMGAIATGLTFHNTDLLREQGLNEAQAAAIFIPQMVGSVVSSLAIGSATDRYRPKPLLLFGGLAMSVTPLLATVASPGFSAAVYGFTGGLAMGSISSAAAALLPKWFGVDNIGAIKGISVSLHVGGSAVGPLLLSAGNDISGSYVPVVVATAIAAAAMTAIAVKTPIPADEIQRPRRSRRRTS